jgi:molecular chaperone DnaK
VIAALKAEAETQLGGERLSRAVVTVPASYDPSGPLRRLMIAAAEAAGFVDVDLLAEPVAAAWSPLEGAAPEPGSLMLVFDLGGGTFDVSILEVKAGVFEVRATGGDPHLGGEDFDARIQQWLLAQVDEDFQPVVRNDLLSRRRLKVAAEQAKRQLSEAEEATITVMGLGDNSSTANRNFRDLETALTRAFFEQLSEPLSRRCLEVCEAVMAEAKMDPRSVDVVLLVGGMTRVPLIRRLVADYFGKPASTDVHPDEAVALGAAVQADELARQSGAALLLDVAGQSLGVGVLGGRVKRLIAKNTQVPVVARDIFLPSRAGQAEVRIPIFQGEGEFQDDNHKLGEVVLRNLQVGNRADTQIEVTFALSSESILSVRAVDLRTGLAEQVRLEARTSLPGPEAHKLSQEQARYASAQAWEDAQEKLRKLLERGEKLARLLQRSAQENPSPEADAAVTTVRGLLDTGNAALQAGNAEQCATVARQLTQVLSGRPA